MLTFPRTSDKHDSESRQFQAPSCDEKPIHEPINAIAFQEEDYKKGLAQQAAILLSESDFPPPFVTTFCLLEQLLLYSGRALAGGAKCMCAVSRPVAGGGRRTPENAQLKLPVVTFTDTLRVRRRCHRCRHQRKQTKKKLPCLNAVKPSLSSHRSVFAQRQRSERTQNCTARRNTDAVRYSKSVGANAQQTLMHRAPLCIISRWHLLVPPSPFGTPPLERTTN